MENPIKQLLINIGDRLMTFDHILINEPSLYNGSLGKILYLFSLGKELKESKYTDKALQLIDVQYDWFEKRQVGTTLADGLAGFGWLLQYLLNKELISEEIIPDMEEIDQLISDSVKIDLEAGNFDLLYGCIGKGVYFLERNKNFSHQNELEVIVDGLIGLSVADSNGLTWLSRKKDESEICYDMGLAHGIPSIIVFLAQAYQAGIRRQSIKKVLTKAGHWLENILIREEDSLVSSAHYLNRNLEHLYLHKSRLGWCYGDLGIAMALFQINKVTGRERSYTDGLMVITRSSQRRLENAQMYFKTAANAIDNGFCHGLPGVLHMMNRFYQFTGATCTDEAFTYWYDQLLSIKLDGSRGIAGFVKYYLNDETIFSMTELDASLLEGTTGIGMALLSRYSRNFNDWDKIFLTNL